MNLFCFSLEGSMDSLYEPVKTHSNNQALACGANVTNPSLLDSTPTRKLPRKSRSLEFSEASKLEKKRLKKAKHFTQRPGSDGSSFENDDSVFKEPAKNNEGNHLVKSTDPGSGETEGIGTSKRLQKLVWNKRNHGSDDGKQAPLHAPCQESEDPTSLEKTLHPQSNHPEKCRTESSKEEYEVDPGWELSSQSLVRIHSPEWYSMPEFISPWDQAHHSCGRKLQDAEDMPFDVTLTMDRSWSPFSCPQTFHCQMFPSPVTGMDLSDGLRTSSFGNFDRFRHHPHTSKPEEKPDDSAGETEQGAEAAGEQNLPKSGQNGSGLGKTMRAISKTMKKKMARRYASALSEGMPEANAEEVTSQAIGEHDTEDGTLRACESMESLYSLNSGQSSSSGIASGSDAASNRDSFRLDEEVPYTGPFCGRAKVHTDFTPSPYDTDSLKLTKGNIIDIINKPTMGTWTGMLNGKVGNFKFIYVDILPNEEAVPKKLKTERRSRQPVPDSLQELLERFHLEDLYSTFLLNGYQSLDDFKDLKESHLIELNITDAEKRAMLLNAAQQDYDVLSEQEEESDVVAENQPSDLKLDQAHLKECPRDSGCYATSEISDNGKEDLDLESLPEMVEDASLAD
ncbi:SAM domain-containing protein SAMSN-1-like isoform X2 [Chiloscyllium plagiosum]|uniref:SAM domain-containing protein SAMSN-1-like isoform X2 n=1 Tax=Chiloscyllium plagiosum TaxID=36176 RepID=UPI001CB82204|nr:SAM domain-containing protein SAMSN-1-like isoform X2 [Chiloscyllium plagiosum]